MFTKVGEIHFDEHGECREDISSVWHHVWTYSNDEKTVVKDGDTFVYCISETNSGFFPTFHFWAVYKGKNMKTKERQRTMPLPDFLTLNNPRK